MAYTLQNIFRLPYFTNILVLCVPLLLLMAILRRKRPYPPGPKGLPIVGNMLMMDQLTHRGLAQLAKTYGGLLHLKIGVLHMVAVSTAEMAREVLQTHDSVFSNRPATVAIAYLSYDRADMAFAHYGPFWRQMRKICVVKLFSRKRAESWSSVREEVDSMTRFVLEQVGSPVNIGELVFELTRNITYRAAFGSGFTTGQTRFISIMQEFSKLFGAFNIADFLPWLGWIHAHDFNKRLKQARGALDEFIDKIIDDHMEKRRNKKNNDQVNDLDTDMVDELLDFYNEDGEKNPADNSQSPIQLTKDHIKAIIMDVMFGGTETVASAIEWAMAELMNTPEELKKVQKELEDVVGLNNTVQETHLDKLTYFKCVIKETLRLHPPIPLLLHETATDVTLGPYFIPARSRVMINAWAIGRDPSVWEDPDKFNPARFAKEGAPDFKGSDFEYIPFGSGRRSCPGMQLGLYGLDLAVANLCHCFTWGLPDGLKPGSLNMDDMFGLTAPKATRLIAVPTYRLKHSLT
ncbi:cytochrome P450 84A1-like [Silene latifolia]|uniref:cytochrome P450 84A1-like n=1 Tax=Silene latifolia TaxID=37657 RepID=UPI003D7735E6